MNNTVRKATGICAGLFLAVTTVLAGNVLNLWGERGLMRRRS